MSEAVSQTDRDNLEKMDNSSVGLAKPSIETLKTPGALLRYYREERQVSLMELAAVLKVTPDKLDALEHDEYEKLPDMVFTRALALSICRLLGADSAPVMALFPSVGSPKLGRDSDGLNQPFKGGAQPPLAASGISEPSSAPKVLVVVVGLLLAAAAVYFWPQIQSLLNMNDDAATQTSTAQQRASGDIGRSNTVQNLQVPGLTALTPEANTSVSEPVPAQMPEEPAPEEVDATRAAEAPASTESSTPAVTAVAATTAAAAMTTENATPAVPVETMRIVAQEPVWVQIRDQANAIVHQSTLPKSRELAITNAPPLRVEIGRADAVKVTVKGQAFDVHPFARGNVARFEVAP